MKFGLGRSEGTVANEATDVRTHTHALKFENGNSSITTRFAACLIEVEFKLEGRTVEVVELLEGIEALLVPARFRIQRIFALIEFRPLLIVRENLLGGGDIDKLLLRAFLLVALLEIIWMPLLRCFPISLNDISLICCPWDAQDLIVISRFRYLLPLLRFLQSLFGSFEVRIYL